MSSESSPTPTPINWDLILKFVGALVAVAGIAFAVYQYTQRGTETKESKRAVTYDKVIRSASGFAQATTKEEAEKWRKEFWEIYFGEINLYADEEVMEAMKAFGGAVREWEKYNSGSSEFSAPSTFDLEDKDGSPKTFNQFATQVALECKRSLE